MKRDYFSIHAHSEYSNLKVIDSTNRFSRMMDYAWDIGLSYEFGPLKTALSYFESKSNI